MGIFEFWRRFADARNLLFANRQEAEVYVRLKDGSELPVKAVKVRGGNPQRIILETFVDPLTSQ